MEEKRNWKDMITIILALISFIVPTIFFIQTSPEEVKTQTYVIFGILLLVLFLGAFIFYIISRWKEMNEDITYTKKNLEDIKKDLNFKDMWNKMDIRLQIIEKLIFGRKNKKGQAIDPRIIFVLILLLLLYLFLKSIGYFN